MRIIGGRLRGRILQSPASRAIRPTSERLRQSIFDILAHRFDDVVEGAHVVDVFAGSGALGLEALSRGAQSALFVDNSAHALRLLHANIAALSPRDVARVLRADATRLGNAPPGPPFTLAFLDPPYDQGLGGPVLAALNEGGWLASHAVVVIEESAKAKVCIPMGLYVVDERVYGEAKLMFLTNESSDDESLSATSRP
jgi:16S rRNA (guanine966-N2)-methyltransferase